MKLKQTFSLLAVSAFSQQFSVLVQAKKNSIKKEYRHENEGGLIYNRVLDSSLQTNFYEKPNPPEETAASVPLMVPSASSSSLLRRNLKKDSSKYFFFEQCSDTCAKNGGIATTLDDDCCAGGVSFLKMKFHAQDQIHGTITLGPTQLPSCGNFQGQLVSSYHSGYKGTKAGVFPVAPLTSVSSSNYEHRIVDCNATCIQKPFGGDACDEDPVIDEKKVEPGSEICIALIKSEANNSYVVAFDEKMPIDVHVSFLSDKGFLVGAIHTSCSVPLSHPWGVRLKDPCDRSNSDSDQKIHARARHINVSDTRYDSTPYLSFIDGISTKYFIAVEDVLRAPDTLSYVQDFSIGFNNCGCTCERFNASTISDIPSLTPTIDAHPSSVPSVGPTSIFTFVPSLAPSGDPTSSPTINPSSMSANPSSDPSFTTTEASTSTTTSSSTASDTSIGNPGPGSPTGPTCNSACTAFILQNCVFFGTNDACDINGEVPAIADDDQEEGADVGTFPPSAAVTKTPSANGTGNFGKGVKGTKGFGKNGSGKIGKKGEKRGSFGKATEGEYSRKKTRETMRQSDSKLAKQSKGADGKAGKGVKGQQNLSNSGYERHLQEIEYQIEYHQSRIDYFEKLLMQIEPRYI